MKFSDALTNSVCRSSDKEVNEVARFTGFPLDLAGFQLDSPQRTNPSPPRQWHWARRRGEPTHSCVEAQGDACCDWPSVSGQVGRCWGKDRGKKTATSLPCQDSRRSLT